MPLTAAPAGTLPRLIGRGAAAGAMAGTVAAAFSFLLAEPVMDRAVRLEEARDRAAGLHAEHAEHAEEVFTRTEQHLGLIVSTIATGVALGVLFAVVYWALHRRDPQARPWERALRLTGAGLVGLWLLPFLRYPANPPGVGDPESLGTRTAGWLAALALSVTAVAIAWRLYDHLREAAQPVRQGAVAATLLVAFATLFLLPDNRDALTVPPGLLWDFRVLSAASSILLWVGLGAAFGLLGLRGERSA